MSGNNARLKVAIIGAGGAVGGYYMHALLESKNVEVIGVVSAKSEHSQKVLKEGLKLKHSQGELVLPAANFTNTPPRIVT